MAFVQQVRQWQILYDFTHRIFKKLNLEKENILVIARGGGWGKWMEEDEEYKQVQGCDVKYPTPTFLAQGTSFMEDSFSTDPGEDGSGGNVSDGEQV